MRLGIGLGLFKQGAVSVGVRLFSAYKSRVIADGGITEADNCGISALNNGLFRQASLLLIPSGYKSGKAYAEIPTNGNGDLTWTRASTALRTNSSGLLESMGSGVPRLSYMYGSCPALLLEPQRTNLATYSDDFSNAAWTKTNSTVTANSTTSPDGTTNADSLVDNSTLGIHALSAVNIGGAGTYTFSFYAKANTLSRVGIFTNSAVNLNLATTALVFDLSSGVVVNSVSGITASIQSVGNGWHRCSAVIPSSASGNYLITTSNGGTTVNYIGSGQSIFVYGAQLELGAYPTTYIPTTTASATRIADSFSRNNIYTNGLITSSGGTWFVELRNNISYTRDSIGALWIGDNSTAASLGNSLNIRSAGTGLLPINKCVAGTLTQLYVTLTSTVKLAIKWNGSTADVFVNGTKVVSATSFSTTNMEFFNGQGNDVPKFIQAIGLHPTPLTDSQCIELTTL